MELGGDTLSASYISMLEHDRVRPSLATLQVLAGRLGQPLVSFLDAPPAPADQARVIVQRGESLLRQHRFSDAIEAFNAAAVPARESGARAPRIRIELGLGQALAGLRQFDLAERHLQEGRTMADAAGDVELAAAAANALGFLAFRARRLAQAREVFQSGLDLLRRSGAEGSETRGKLLANLGRVYVELGLPAQALACLHEASTQVGRSADPSHRALLLFNLGVASERQRAYVEAQGYLEQAEALLQVHENLRLLGMVKRSLGMLRLEQGRLQDAEGELAESLQLARQSHDDEGAAQTLVEQARLHVRRGDVDRARRDAAEAQAIARRIQDEAEAARAAAADASALAASGQTDDAAARYVEAIGVFERLGMAADLAAACRDLGFVHLARTEHEQAARQFARAFDLLRAERIPSVAS